jgi:PAS domain S-box-containing protein
MNSSLKVSRRSALLNQSLTSEINVLNKRLELALEAVNMGVWDYDPINNILIWDDKQVEIFGVDKNSFEGLFSAWVTCRHPEDRERASKESQDAVANERNFNTEFRIIKNGEVRFIKGQAIVVLDSNQNVVRMIGVNYDVSETKETLTSLEKEKEKAEVANLAKSLFLATRRRHEI